MHAYMSENQFCSTTAVQQSHHVDAVGCQDLYRADSIFVCDVLQIPRECIRICSERTPFGLRAWSGLGVFDRVRRLCLTVIWTICSPVVRCALRSVTFCNFAFCLYSLWSVLTQRVVKSRRMEWVGHLTRMGDRRVVYSILVGKPEGKRTLGRPRRRWEDNKKMNLQEVGYGGVDWIELAQDRDMWQALVTAVMKLRIP